MRKNPSNWIAAFFIGSNLIRYFLEKKYFVINIDKLSYSSNKYNLEKIPNKKNYIFIKSDIGNRKKIFKCRIP